MSMDIYREDKKVERAEAKVVSKNKIENVEEEDIQKKNPTNFKKEKKEKGLCDCIIN